MASTADVATTKQPKETKAQKVERLKLAKNPWEHFDEVANSREKAAPPSFPSGPISTSSGGASIPRATASASPAAQAAKARPPSTS